MNIQDLNASDFNIEALNDIIKDVRNTRKAVMGIGDTEETQEKYDIALGQVQAGLTQGGLEGLTAVQKATNDMKRAHKKLNEDPAIKEAAFSSAILKLVDFTATNELEELLEQAA